MELDRSCDQIRVLREERSDPCESGRFRRRTPSPGATREAWPAVEEGRPRDLEISILFRPFREKSHESASGGRPFRAHRAVFFRGPRLLFAQTVRFVQENACSA